MKINKKIQKGFTLPEVLITLIVIGIIAAITIMIINSNIRKAEVESKLKQNYAIFNNALIQATIEHGAVDSWSIYKDKGASTLTEKEFTETYLIPYIKVLKPMKRTNLKNLGYKNSFKLPNGNYHQFFTISRDMDVFFLNNGTFVTTLYNGQKNGLIIDMDINGQNGPNMVGKDTFAFYIDFNDKNPRVWGFGITLYSPNTLKTNCASSGDYCSSLIQQNGWKIPKDYPVKI